MRAAAAPDTDMDMAAAAPDTDMAAAVVDTTRLRGWSWGTHLCESHSLSWCFMLCRFLQVVAHGLVLSGPRRRTWPYALQDACLPRGRDDHPDLLAVGPGEPCRTPRGAWPLPPAKAVSRPGGYTNSAGSAKTALGDTGPVRVATTGVVMTRPRFPHSFDLWVMVLTPLKVPSG